MHVRATATVNGASGWSTGRRSSRARPKSWQYESLNDEKLADAFLDLWFDRCNAVPNFNAGHLDYWPKEEKLVFGNGSHRIRLLANPDLV